MIETNFLQVGEVARQINRSSECVRLYERQGKLPAIKTSRGVRLFNKLDVDRFAAQLVQKKAAAE